MVIKSGAAVAGLVAVAAAVVFAGWLVGGADQAQQAGKPTAHEGSKAAAYVSRRSRSGSGGAGAQTLTTNLIPQVVSRAEPAVVAIAAAQAPSSAQSRAADTGLGSGFIISPDGYVLTNEHVIAGASAVDVRVPGYKNLFSARVVGQDGALDLAVLKITAPKPLPTLALGTSSDIAVGQWDIAIGNPDGLANTVTVGVISAEGRPLTLGSKSYTDLLQTDTPISAGNSGGPLLDLSGHVIAISTAVNQTGQYIGFAIPIDTVKKVLGSLLTKGYVSQPWLGVWIQTVTKHQAQVYGTVPAAGALVVYVYPKSPAAAAGVKAGDVVVAVDGATVSTSEDVVTDTRKGKVGSMLHLTVRRRGLSHALDLSARLRQEPNNLPPPPS